MFLLWIVYLAVSGTIFLVPRWVARPIPARYAVGFLVLPIAFCLPGFVKDRTILPTDHVRLFPPWKVDAAAAPRNANLNDAATQIAPWAKAVRMAWKEGVFPWRNRWNGCGMPLAANGQSGAFSPYTLMMMALPLARAFTLAVAVKIFLALVGLWLWLVEMGLSRGAALFGAVSFAFSMTMTPWVLFALSGVFCLWPWALFAIERMREEPRSGRAGLLLAAILASWVLAGHPESAVLGALFASLFLGSRLLVNDGSLDRRALPRLLAAGLLAAALTAFLWIPQLLAIRASNRYRRAQEIRASLPITLAPHAPAWRYGFLTAVFPRALGDDFTSPQIPGAAASFPEMALGYFGIVGWVLALQIWRPGRPRDRRELALLVPLVCGLAVGTATWPIFDLFFSMPFIKLVLPLRFLSWVALAGSAIAAFELERLQEDFAADRVAPGTLLVVPAALLAAVLLTFFRFRAAHAAAGGLPSQKHALALSLTALAATGLVLLWRGYALPRRDVGVFLAALAGLELFEQGTRLYRWGSVGDVFPPTPLVRFLQSQKSPFRVVGEGAALFPGTNVFAGVEDIRTHDAVERRDYVRFLDQTCGYDPNPYFKHIRDTNAPVLDFLNVRFLVTENAARLEHERWKLVYSGTDGRVFENRHVLPRVFAPRQIRFEGGPSEPEPSALQDWGGMAIVHEHPDVAPGRVVLAENVPVEVTDYRETADSVRFLARSASPLERPVLVTSLVQDGGWTARDGAGRQLTTVRANGIFLGLVLEPGKREVRLDYSPPGLLAGGLASLASATIFVLWLLVRRRAAVGGEAT
jgi:hypothetical protein